MFQYGVVDVLFMIVSVILIILVAFAVFLLFPSAFSDYTIATETYVLLALWSLTIVGYFIKYFEYCMIPYILAENPNIKMREAFRISKELTHGDKRHLLKISVTVVLWHLLGLVTFNLSNIFFVNPYEFTMFAEAYVELRKAKRPSLTDKELLNDRRLVIEEAKDTDYHEREVQNELVKRGAKKKYTLSSYILLFFIFSFIGWLYEVAIHLIEDGRFVNRGTMYGPWLPIYGFGGVFLYIVLNRFKKNWLIVFMGSFVFTTFIPRFKPSVEDIATVLTLFEPNIC